MSVESRRRPVGCIFCGAAELTKEHIFPRWLAAVLTPAVVGKNVTSERTQRSAHRKGRQEWSAGDVAGFTARLVCASCNNGWMSDLETRVQPVLSTMIAGHPTTLAPAAQLDLAAWTAMKAFVVEFALAIGGDIVATAADRRGLMDARHPLGAVPVRLGAVERDGIPNSVRRIVYNVGSDGSQHGLAACTTFTLGCAVLQVSYGLGILINWLQTSEPRPDYLPMNPPCPRDIVWPPTTVLDAQSLGKWENPIPATDPASIMASNDGGEG